MRTMRFTGCLVSAVLWGSLGARAAEAPPHAEPSSKPAATQPATTQPVASQPAAVPLTLTRAETVHAAFNPSLGQTGNVRFALSREASLTVTVYGPNQEEIARAVENRRFPAGWHTVTWNGRDRDGNIVPNEAYFVTLQAVEGAEVAALDPLLESGGERILAAEVEPLEDGRRLSYQLPKPCRVLVRAAVVDGPLLRTLVNWEPRGVGLCVEQWDGRDADGLRRILDVPNMRMGVMAFALPDLTLITTGNQELAYREYYTQHSSRWPRKPAVVRSVPGENVLSSHALLPPHLNCDPRVQLRFPDLEGPRSSSAPAAASSLPASLPATQPGGADQALVLSSSPVLVRVDIPDALERDFMNDQKFELIVYVDDRRVIEAEQAHVPFNYPWDTSGLPPGRHVLTINVASFRNHVGTASRLVDVQR